MSTAAAKFAWLQQSHTLLVDAYWPPLAPALNFAAAELVQAVRTLHADTVRFGTAGKYALLPSRVMPPHPQLQGRDLLAEALTALEPLGTRTIAYVPVGHGLPRTLLARERPDWALRLDDGSLPSGVQHFGGEPLAPVCPFGPYRQDILTFVGEVVDGHAIHGLYLDGPYHNWNMGGPLAICQCPACRTQYRQATGEELPANRDAAGPPDPEREARLARYRDWVAQGLLELLRAIRARACRHGEELPVLFNAFAAAARPPAFERQFYEAADGFLLEAELAGLKGLATGRHLGKIVWRYTQPHDGWPRLSTPRRERANLHAALETLTWGGAPIVSYAGRFLLDRRHAAPLAELFALRRKHASRFAGAQPVRHLGLVCLARPLGHAEAFQRALSGAYLALQSQGVPLEVLPRSALSEAAGLAGWPALMLPSAAGLTAAEVASLRAYAAAGGRLAILDPGEPGAANGLLACFGLHPAADSPIAHQQLRYWQGEWEVYLQAPDAPGDLAPLRGLQPTAGTGECRVLAWSVNGNGEKLAPAIVASPGRDLSLVLFPLAELYEQTREPALAAWIAALAERVAGPSPLRLPGADAWIHSALHEKPGLRLLWLHDTAPADRSCRLAVALRLPAGAAGLQAFSLRRDRPLAGRVAAGVWHLDDLELTGYDCLAFSPS